MIKKLWGIQVVKDLFWFSILIYTLRFLWKTFEYLGLKSHEFYLIVSSNISLGYIKLLDAIKLLKIEEYVLIKFDRFYFASKNMTFIIGESCSGLLHYYYYFFLILLFPNITNILKIKSIFFGLILIYLFRVFLLLFQIFVFLKFYEYYEYLHTSSTFIMLGIIFLCWMLVIAIRDRHVKTTKENSLEY